MPQKEKKMIQKRNKFSNSAQTKQAVNSTTKNYDFNTETKRASLS